MREKDGYRDQLESIIAAHPQGEMMTVQDVIDYTGRSRNYVTRHFVFVGKGQGQYITRTQLAKQLNG